MPQTQNKAVLKWLVVFTFLLGILVVYGGYVRLTKSGLSIVEWNPISGYTLPKGKEGWAIEFEKYKLSPEYIKINSNMNLDEYKKIFIVEWIHRNLARFVGLFYALPFFYFVLKKLIPIKETRVYIFIGLLFIGQALMGWLMVASGLINRPSVDHIRLTMHLLLALALFGTSLWIATGHHFGFFPQNKKVNWDIPSKILLTGFIILIIQISYGGMTAGLKAGHLSDTWPLMFGKLTPQGLFSSPINLLQLPQTIFYIHRWLGFLVILAYIFAYIMSKKASYLADSIQFLKITLIISTIQVVLGISVVIFHVQLPFALIHQATAVLLLGFSILSIFKFRQAEYLNK